MRHALLNRLSLEFELASRSELASRFFLGISMQHHRGYYPSDESNSVCLSGLALFHSFLHHPHGLFRSAMADHLELCPILLMIVDEEFVDLPQQADAVNATTFFLTNQCTLIGACPVSESTSS